MKRIILAIISLLFCGALAHATSCPTGYAYSVPITIAAQTGTSADQSNFPVYFAGNSLLATVANSGYAQSSTGVDVVFCTASSGGTLLNYKLTAGTYVATTGAGEWWIQVPTIGHSTTKIIYALVGSTGASDLSNEAGVWSNGYITVAHLSNGTTLSVADSLGTNNGTNYSSTAVTGKIDGGAGFASASSQYENFGASTTLDTSSFTFSAWAKGTTFTGAYNSVVGREGSSSFGGYTLLVKSNGKLAVYVNEAYPGNGYDYDGTGSHTLSTGTWYLLAFTYTPGGSLIGYVNGAQDASTAAGAQGLNGGVANAVLIGNSVTAGRFWNGSMDELHFASVARSADWLLDEYNNQNAPTSFYSVGSASPSAAVSPTYSPVAGTYSSTQTVAITSTTSGAQLCWNTTGSPATNGLGTGCTTGTALSNGGTITVSASETVYAVAGTSSLADSAVGSASYVIGGSASTAKPFVWIAQ